MEGLSEEKCALVAELARVLGAVRQLEAHMAAGAAAGDQRCRELVSATRAAADRAVHLALSSGCLTTAVVGSRPESPPSAGDGGGSPRSAGSDQAADSRARGNAAEAGHPCKKRKALPKRSTQVRVSAVQDVAPLDDGLSWRKYGQKDILRAKYPRAYFRCTHRHTQGCHASKQVQRADADPLLFDVVYHGDHTCAQAAAAAASDQAAARPGADDHGAQPPQAQQREQASAAGPVLPFSLLSPSNKQPAGGAADDAGGGGGAASSGFPAVRVSVAATASLLAPPATLEGQLVISGGGGGIGLAAARNVPDAELASMTNSPMGEMEDFMFPLDAADFLENPASYF